MDDLRPPLSPAFVLLGIEPASVQRPDSPRAISTALLSLVKDESALPRNFAMEVAPFWLESRPSFEFDSLYNAGWLTTVKRSSSISLATTPRVLSNDTTGTSIGFATGRSSVLVACRSGSLLLDRVSRLASGPAP